MRIAITVTFLALGSTLALAQAEAPAKPSDSQQSTGRTVSPDTKGVQQPQGPTGPTDTQSGGAPPESPQGQTPPGMQAAPGGSDKTIVDPDAKTPPSSSSTAQPSSATQSPTPPTAAGIFTNGVLTVSGANPDNQTAPAKFSKRNDTTDQLAIAAYSLRHLVPEQRSRIFQALRGDKSNSGNTLGMDPVIGAELTTALVLGGLEPLPQELTRDIVELRGLAFVREGNKIVLVSPTMQRVVAVIEK